MPNLRIVYDNAANSTSQLTASTTSGTLLASNLLNDRKGKIHRATGLSVQYVAQWTIAKTINMAALAFTNFSASATMRVRGYANTTDTIDVTAPVFDSGTAACCAAPYGARADGSGAPLGVNLFGFGGSSYACRWFAGGTVKMVAIDVADPFNASAYLEAGRLILGDWWSPTFNADYGAALSFPDLSKNERDDAGDLRSDTGYRCKKLTLQQSAMPPADRQKITDIFRVNGMTLPLFLSVFPEDADSSKEQAYTVYGKLTQMSGITLAAYNQYAWPLEIEEV